MFPLSEFLRYLTLAVQVFIADPSAVVCYSVETATTWTAKCVTEWTDDERIVIAVTHERRKP